MIMITHLLQIVITHLLHIIITHLVFIIITQQYIHPIHFIYILTLLLFII